MVAANGALMAQLLAWEGDERAGRELPAGDVLPEHRTPTTPSRGIPLGRRSAPG
jgi:hypothetical protein